MKVPKDAPTRGAYRAFKVFRCVGPEQFDELTVRASLVTVGAFACVKDRVICPVGIAADCTGSSLEWGISIQRGTRIHILLEADLDFARADHPR